MKIFDLELAGEFLSMAANLIYIKTQMLLPKEKNDDGTEPEDPRAQLAQRLIEYKQFKEASLDLAGYSEDQRYTYYRSLFAADAQTVSSHQPTGFRNATVFDLFAAFQTCIDRLAKQKVQHNVNIIPVTVEEKRAYIIKQISIKNRLNFFEMVKNETRIVIVVTFLAILDLIKQKVIAVRQDELFEDIIIYKVSEINNN
jgi:segregation and condensation protein A